MPIYKLENIFLLYLCDGHRVNMTHYAQNDINVTLYDGHGVNVTHYNGHQASLTCLPHVHHFLKILFLMQCNIISFIEHQNRTITASMRLQIQKV